jgi:hypothetical protein
VQESQNNKPIFFIGIKTVSSLHPCRRGNAHRRFAVI